LVAVGIFRGVVVLGLDDTIAHGAAASSSPPKASPAIPCAPHIPILSKSAACAGLCVCC
jgi:hypothetical protein